MNNAQRAIAFSCHHVPFADPRAIDWAMAQIADVRPHYVVFLGDLHESDAASRFSRPEDAGHDLMEEFSQANDLLMRTRHQALQANDQAQCVILPGNHEANLLEPGRIDRRIRGLCDWRKNVQEIASGRWQLPVTDYNLDRTHGVFRLGHQVVFGHGWATGKGPVQREAFHLANDFGLYVHGHTHRPRPVSEVEWCDLPLNRWVANAGCMCDLNPPYMRRHKKHNWGHGCVVVEAVPVKSPRVGRYWDAETRVLTRFDDWRAKNGKRGRT